MADIIFQVVNELVVIVFTLVRLLALPIGFLLTPTALAAGIWVNTRQPPSKHMQIFPATFAAAAASFGLLRLVGFPHQASNEGLEVFNNLALLGFPALYFMFRHRLTRPPAVAVD